MLIFILPFILIGIGVDDGFVIVTSYRQLRAQRRAQKLQERQQASVRSEEHKEEHERTHVDDDEDIGELIAEGLGNCAMSIVYTTLTDVMAFSFGCIGSIPAIRYFCAYAAVAVAFDFFFQITFFVAVLVLDERADAAEAKELRQKKLEDVCGEEEEAAWSFGWSSAFLSTKASTAPPTPQLSSDVTPSSTPSSSTRSTPSESSRWMWEEYVHFLMSRGSLAAVAVCMVGFTGFNGWALNNLQNDFDPRDTCPDDS
jgi:predicted RND superfamily exporter protein